MSESPINDQTISVGIIGYGFMGQTHARAYQQAQRDGFGCQLKAVADTSLSSFADAQLAAGNLDVGSPAIDYTGVALFEDSKDVIESPDIDLVSICTHTDSHVSLAMKALNAGKHVLVEKPIAIDSNSVQRLVDHTGTTNRICLPAMCMRFWPAWVKLREMIQSQPYGKVRSAVFHRLGSRPNWAQDFYANEIRSGGVLHDLHIHDTDFIVHCFGVPDAVTTSGDGLHLSTIYHYPRSPVHVTAHAAWDHQPTVGFQMKCTVVCEHATIDFDINRDDQLIVYDKDTSKTIPVASLSGYDGEVRNIINMIHMIRNQEHRPQLTTRDGLDSAVAVAKILEFEQRSMQLGKTITLDWSCL